MNIQTIKNGFNRGQMQIEEIKWLIDSLEQLQAENGVMAEKHAEKDMAIAQFMRIIEQQKEEIILFRLTEASIIGRLQKQTLQIKEMKQNSRLTRFFDMAEENLKLAKELAKS